MSEVVKLLTGGGHAAVTVIKSTDIVNKAIRLFGLSPVAAAALGRTMSACVLLAQDLKTENAKLTAIINGGGEIGTITVTASSNGNVKGFVENPNVQTHTKNGKLDVGRAVGNNGKITVVKETGTGDPYVGSSRLVSGEIAEDFAQYLSESEQINCALSLGVLIGENGKCLSAGGVFAKLLPGASNEAVADVEKAFEDMGNVSGAMKSLSAENFALSAFTFCNPQIIGQSSAAYRCDCGKARINRVLRTLSKQEIDEIIEERGNIEVVCHFCNKKYLYDREQAYRAMGNVNGKKADSV